MPSFTDLIDQLYFVVPSFTLESGRTLQNASVAYKTWGKLNETKDNVMIICHAFTGSADVEDWWGPLMGHGKSFDPTRYFIFCANVLGSPYGTASPLTINPATNLPYGPEFPLTSIRDDVRIHKLVLDHLGVRSVAVVIGGSMGGMAVLEWPLCVEPGYIRHIVPIATSARHSAWCISWGEAQRQSIYSDPAYRNGYYALEAQPKSGLAAARMAALLTYRSRDSFESRFGRKSMAPNSSVLTPPDSPRSQTSVDIACHNDGLREPADLPIKKPGQTTPSYSEQSSNHKPTIFSAQSYLRYQGDKFTARFDANSYIHITRKLDTHDISRGRSNAPSETMALAEVLATLPPRALVVGVQTDGLFTLPEQREIAQHIPGAELAIIDSPDGHDGFLLEFEQLNRYILQFLKREYPEYYQSEIVDVAPADGFKIHKTSMFGEAEADITRW